MDRQLLYRSRGAGTKRERLGLLVVAASLALAMAATPAASQEPGTVTGVVTDEATGQLLEGTRVTYDGGAQTALATQAGRYVLANIPAGTHTLTFELIGYETVTEEVEVVGGATTGRDISMVAGAIRMQDLVVSGVARATPKSKLPIVVEKLGAEDLPVPALSTELLLAAKLPGVKVVRGSGQPGSSADILLRGATSITGSQSALFVIDGVISGTTLDDLSGLDVESIEVVKGAAGASLYGSRAANGVIVVRTKRGGGFAGQDYSRIVVRNEAGGEQLQGSIQLSNYHPWCVVESTGDLCDVRNDPIPDFTDPDAPNPALDGDNPSVAFQDNEWPTHMPQYDHVDRIYNTGVYVSNYVATEGRDGNTSYRASVERNDQQGVLSRWHDGFQRRGFRINLDHQIRDYLSLSVSTAYNHLDQEDIGGNPFFRLTFMGPYVDLLARDSTTRAESFCPSVGCFHHKPDPLTLEQHPLYRLEAVDFRDKQENQRASGNVVWRPYSWMDLEGNFGIDKNWTRQKNVTPDGLRDPQGNPSTGSLLKDQRIATRVNSDVTLSMGRAFGDISTRTRLRYLQEFEDAEYVQATGSDWVVDDVFEFDNFDAVNINADSWTTIQRAEGFFLISGLEYQGKYIFDGVVRRDGSSLFGEDQRWQTYWRTAAAWRLDEEPWWPLASVNQMKLRAALGTAGRRPAFWHQYESYGIDAGVVSPNTLGNGNLRPQRSTEIEAGIDLFIHNRIAAEITYAATTSRDQILEVPLPAPFGFSRQVQNAGVMSNETWELSVNAPVIDRENLGWDLRVNLDRTRQRIDSLYRSPFADPGGYFYYRAGEKFGAFYGQVWATECADLPTFSEDPATQSNICESYFEVNDDGLLVFTGGFRITDGTSGKLWGTDTTFVVKYATFDNRMAEQDVTYAWGMPIPVFGQDPTITDPEKTCDYKIQFEVGCGPSQYMGNTTPNFNVSLMNTFRWRGLRLYVLLDGEFGAQIYNQTRQWAYRDHRSGDQDQFGKDDGLEKPVAYYQRLYNTNALNSWFVEGGDFVKLRELALTYTVSSQLLDSYFGGRVSQMEIELIGQNLLTFTNYSGYDPEVGSGYDPNGRGNGGSSAVGRIDEYQYPNYRTVSASIRLAF